MFSFSRDFSVLLFMDVIGLLVLSFLNLSGLINFIGMFIVSGLVNFLGLLNFRDLFFLIGVLGLSNLFGLLNIGNF